MIAAPGGGCCTVFPFEAAIWLLEEQEELFGNGSGRRVQRASTGSCNNLHRLVSKGSRSNLLHRNSMSRSNLYQTPSLSGTNSSLQSMGNNLQSMNNLQSLGQAPASPQQLNWYRGDSISGVDREFIYKVCRLSQFRTERNDKCMLLGCVTGSSIAQGSQEHGFTAAISISWRFTFTLLV